MGVSSQPGGHRDAFLIAVPGAGTGQLGKVRARPPCCLEYDELLAGWEVLGFSCTPVGSAGFRDTVLGCPRRVGGKDKGDLTLWLSRLA